MRWVWRGLAAVAVLLVVVVLAAGGYGYYRFIGVPFTLNAALNTQTVREALRSPQILSQIGFLDGSFADFHSGKLDPYSLDERKALYERLRSNIAAIRGFDRSGLSAQERLSRDIALWSYERRLADERYPW